MTQPAQVAVTGAPGYFMPDTVPLPYALADLDAWTAAPVSTWDTGAYVPLGDGTDAHWTGTAWAAGIAHPEPPYPDADAVRQFTGVTANALADDDLALIMDGEQDSQRKLCRVTGATLAPALAAGFMRRCARAIAARGIPLGMVGDAEFGPTRLPMVDAEIERLEGPYRRLVFG